MPVRKQLSVSKEKTEQYCVFLQTLTRPSPIQTHHRTGTQPE
jgi:hypothetical protein